MKVCSLCNTEKPVTEFHKSKRSKDGLHSYCKPCNTEQAKKYLQSEKGRKALKKYHKSEKGKEALKRGYEKKQAEGYFTYGKGAISNLKLGATRRSLEFELNESQLETWWKGTPDNCIYCGTSVDQFISIRDSVVSYDGTNHEIKKFKRFFKSSKQKSISRLSIDRVDNAVGYNINNIVKACWICNHLKSDFFTFLQMKQMAPEIMERLVRHIEGSNPAEGYTKG